MTGNALRRARAFLGYTQVTMAEALGLSLATYQRREALAEEAIPRAEALAMEVLTKSKRPEADENASQQEACQDGALHVPYETLTREACGGV